MLVKSTKSPQENCSGPSVVILSRSCSGAEILLQPKRVWQHPACSGVFLGHGPGGKAAVWMCACNDPLLSAAGCYQQKRLGLKLLCVW